MQYLCLIYQDEAIVQNRSKSELDAIYAEYTDFTAGLKLKTALINVLSIADW